MGGRLFTTILRRRNDLRRGILYAVSDVLTFRSCTCSDSHTLASLAGGRRRPSLHGLDSYLHACSVGESSTHVD